MNEGLTTRLKFVAPSTDSQLGSIDPNKIDNRSRCTICSVHRWRASQPDSPRSNGVHLMLIRVPPLAAPHPFSFNAVSRMWTVIGLRLCTYLVSLSHPCSISHIHLTYTVSHVVTSSTSSVHRLLTTCVDHFLLDGRMREEQVCLETAPHISLSRTLTLRFHQIDAFISTLAHCLQTASKYVTLISNTHPYLNTYQTCDILLELVLR